MASKVKGGESHASNCQLFRGWRREEEITGEAQNTSEKSSSSKVTGTKEFRVLAQIWSMIEYITNTILIVISHLFNSALFKKWQTCLGIICMGGFEHMTERVCVDVHVCDIVAPTHLDVKLAHAVPICHLWACAVVSFCQHCPGQEILTCRISCTVLKGSQKNFRKEAWTP